MITLKKAETVEEVEQILKDPELFDRIADDGWMVDDFEPPFDENHCYMMIILGDEAIGTWYLHPLNGSTLAIHCNILKEYREHGKEAGRLIVEWFVNDCPVQYQKLNAEIPAVYPEVYHFTKKFGFNDEGINRLSIMKNGELTDQYRLGLTRNEAKSFLRLH